MEQIQALLESEKYTSLSASDSAAMKLMLENTEKELNQMVSEGTVSGDIAQFTPILMPMVRRVYPNLIANELLGVQPMAMPTGFIYALTNEFRGDHDQQDALHAAGNTKLKIVKAEAGHANIAEVTDVALYTEGDLHLVPVATTSVAILAEYTNEAAFKHVFKNYTGTYATAAAERLGRDMKEVGFSISKKSVEARSRALKGQYTVEMYQDLKAQHGLLADEEIMSLMSYEMQAEIDREIVDFVNDNATQLSNTLIDFGSAEAKDSGRWEIERYRAQVIRLAKESGQIGLDTKRGQGNVIIVSPKVVTMFEQVGTFKTAEQANGTKQPVSGGVAGTFDGRYKVIVDQYATDDYCTVLYKGADRRDAMGFFAPYVPMSFTKVTHADSGQPAVIAKTRYALDTIPGVSAPTSNDRAATYARSFGIDFTSTVLA